MEEMQRTTDEEFVKRVETAAREGAREGVKECGRTWGGGRAKGRIVGYVVKVVSLLMIAILVLGGLSKWKPLGGLFGQEIGVEGHDMTLENRGFFGYTVADFEEVILGDSSKLKKLEVYSQDVSQMVQLTDAGLGKLKIFSKSKYYTYYGTAIYTVDLGKLDKNSIKLNEEDLTVVLTIPHTEMTTLDIPQDKMEIGDTQKGVLAFGELSMNDEDSKNLMSKAREDMTQKLEEDKVQEQADKIAKLTVWELYQPLITKMAPGYSLNVEFQKVVVDAVE